MVDICYEVFGDHMRKPTKDEEVLRLLSDGHWHSARELSVKVSHRFGGYLFNLKKRGVTWEKRLDPARPTGEAWWQYRLLTYVGSDNQTHMVVPHD